MAKRQKQTVAELNNELDLTAPAAPTLTLDPIADEAAEAAKLEAPKAEPVKVEDTPLSPEEQKMVKKVAVSSFLGNFIEWFDYASYSYFATTIALVFFPSGNHTVAMLQTFGRQSDA